MDDLNPSLIWDGEFLHRMWRNSSLHKSLDFYHASDFHNVRFFFYFFWHLVFWLDLYGFKDRDWGQYELLCIWQIWFCQIHSGLYLQLIFRSLLNFIIWILLTILYSYHLILLQHLLFKSVSLLKYNESWRILHGEFLEKLQNSPWRNFTNSPWRKCGEILENSPWRIFALSLNTLTD